MKVIMLPTVPLGHPVTKFDVSFPEKLLKIVATIGEIFSLKFTKYRLAAEIRPDPLRELKRSPDLLLPPCKNSCERPWGPPHFFLNGAQV